MRTIRLEILRHGPPHNQLLSPLTEYIALCENHPAVTLHVPFEHAEFSLRLRAMQYKDGIAAQFRPLEVENILGRMTDIMSQVPGLIRELAEQSASANEPFHLRLILSANELALLPFEMANASHSFASSGQSLSLQSEVPVCITREVRRVATSGFDWPPPPSPKILFAAASPGAPVPLEPHLLALRKVISPWVFHYRPDDENERKARVGEHLTVLPQASLREIEKECATGQYTHVHILAHGVPLTKGDDRRYGLALHGAFDADTVDVVDGERLAKSLRPPLPSMRGGFVRPAVVTLAACDGGAQGTVVGAGASIAHTLHEEGIPLVVASQFPLSFPGSVILTEELYTGLFWGHDPRILLVNLRRKLKTQVPSSHDWASIVAYATLPPDFEATLVRVRKDQAFRGMEAVINHADRMLQPGAPEPQESQLEIQREKLNEARNRIEKLLPEQGRDKADVYGLLASAEKRLAQILWRMKSLMTNTAGIRADVRERLASSRKYYKQAFRSDQSQAWALVQAIALSAVLDKPSRDEWDLARITSELELTHARESQHKAWAYANLMELYLLAPLVGGDPPIDQAMARGNARSQAEKFQKVTDLSLVEIHSTRRQIMRYPEFFAMLNSDLNPVAQEARQLADLLPVSPVFA